jgi:hypothetical protein
MGEASCGHVAFSRAAGHTTNLRAKQLDLHLRAVKRVTPTMMADLRAK